MQEELPVSWISTMLASNRLHDLAIWAHHRITTHDATVLLEGLKCSTSLKELKIEYPSAPTFVAVSVAVQAKVLQLETLNFDGLSQYGFKRISCCLQNCISLKKLILTPGNRVLILDDGIDDFCRSLETGCPNLEFFTFAFDHATPQAVYKLFNALATKSLKSFSFASADRPYAVFLDDSAPFQRFLAANQDLELFGVRNFHLQDMTRLFGVMEKHTKLKEVGLYNTLMTPGNASALGRVLSTVPLQKLDIVNFGEANRHEPLIPALLEGLCNNTTLTFLDVYLNEIHESDLCALAVVLEENGHIQKLSVSQQFARAVVGNDAGLVRFGQALARNQGLTSLCFKWDQTVSEPVVRTFLDGIKVNSTLKWADIHWLAPSPELDFYVGLNNGAKQALHSPLNIMPFAFVRADKYRNKKRGIKNSPFSVFREGVEEQYSREEMLVLLMSGMAEIFGGSDKEERKPGPPSELYFFVRERCDLFQDAAAVARRRQANQAQAVEEDVAMEE